LTVIAALALSSFWRNYQWENDLNLWSDIAGKSPLKARPHTNVGISHDQAGDISAAEEEYLISIRLDPSYLYPYAPLAVIYGKRGDIDRAMEILLWFTSEQPLDYKARAALGVAYMRKGRFKEARVELEEALRINPDYELAKDRLSEVRAALKDDGL